MRTGCPAAAAGRERSHSHQRHPGNARLARYQGDEKLATNKDRAEFITAHCTGLMIPDLAGLTVPDWTELQERIDDF